MVRRKIDNRIRILIENCVSQHQRSLFVVVGEKARDSVMILHEMLSKAEVKARPSVLWCYKKELGFSTHKKKRKRLKKAMLLGTKQSFEENDSLEYFVSSTNIRYCYYSETHSILGQTFGMAILQDFEALTPNLLARTVETIEGGGMILILLQTLTSLKQLYTMAMDVHARYRTEAHQDIVCRFNERFILSLPTCINCLVLDDKLNILPISSNALTLKPLPAKAWDGPKSPEEEKLLELKSSLDTSQPLNVLVKMCKTLDQAKAVQKFGDALAEMTLRSTVTLTSARGRGKSAALGLAVAAAIAFKYTNIVVTSPHPENLKTFFAFLLQGLEALGYEKTTDFEEVRSSNPEFNKAIIQVNVVRNHRQSVKYIQPSADIKLTFVELLVIDEAAAIPLLFVKALMGPYLVFLASTINGYEGTGRSLSLKLIDQLRKESVKIPAYPQDQKMKIRSLAGRVLQELVLNESIRYSMGDKVEDWLNRILCMDVMVPPAMQNPPAKDKCKLYYVNRDTLFSYNKYSERFLRKIMAILVASHYKNSPNDLLIMSDAPAHHIFCLCAPTDKKLPEVLCVIQVCLEGKLTQSTVKHELSRGRRGAGDLIPWTISQEFLEEDFPSLSGARIVRIATHPEYQRKGYGLKALELLQDFYEGKFIMPNAAPLKMTPKVVDDVDMPEDDEATEEKLMPKNSLPALLFELDQVRPDVLDYLGVSYGISEELLRFWKKAGMYPVYLGYTANQLTGEHSCIMLKQLQGRTTNSTWLPSFCFDFCEKTIQTMLFLKLDVNLALALVSDIPKEGCLELSRLDVQVHLDCDDLNLLQCFTNTENCYPPNHIIKKISEWYFSHRILGIHVDQTERVILFSHGILHKSFEDIAFSIDRSMTETEYGFQSCFKKLALFVIQLVNM